MNRFFPSFLSLITSATVFMSFRGQSASFASSASSVALKGTVEPQVSVELPGAFEAISTDLIHSRSPTRVPHLLFITSLVPTFDRAPSSAMDSIPSGVITSIEPSTIVPSSASSTGGRRGENTGEDASLPAPKRPGVYRITIQTP